MINQFLNSARLASRAIRNNVISGNNSLTNLQNIFHFTTPLNSTSGSSILSESSENTRYIAEPLSSIIQLDDNGEEYVANNQFNRFKNWLSTSFTNVINNVPSVNFRDSFSKLIGTLEALKTFDFNITDIEIKQLQEKKNLSLFALWGGTLGKAFGYTIAAGLGAGISMVLPVIGSGILAKNILFSVFEEGGADVFDDLMATIKATKNIFLQNSYLDIYMTSRRWIKKIPHDVLESIVGEKLAEYIKTVWGTPNAPTLSFNELTDNWVTGLGKQFGQKVQTFVEEFLEEAWDGFIEGGYIITGEWDAAFHEAQIINQVERGPYRGVDIYPDANNEDEVFTLRGIPEQQIIPASQQLIQNYRLLNNRSVGNIVASSFDEPQIARPFLRKITIEMSSRPKPPWVDANNKPAKRVYVSIPDIKIGTTWKEIKKAAKPYEWGRFRAVAKLANKRAMVVHGSSHDIALNKLKEFLDLSETPAISILVSEEADVPTKAKKIPTMIYPRSCKILYRQNTLDNNGNIVINNQYFDTDIEEWVLWTDEPPQEGLVISLAQN